MGGGWGNDAMGRVREAEKTEPGFLDPITGRKGSLTENSFNGIPIFVNDYIGTETLVLVHASTIRIRFTGIQGTACFCLLEHWRSRGTASY